MSARFTTFDGAFKKKKAVSLGGRGRETRDANAARAAREERAQKRKEFAAAGTIQRYWRGHATRRRWADELRARWEALPADSPGRLTLLGHFFTPNVDDARASAAAALGHRTLLTRTPLDPETAAAVVALTAVVVQAQPSREIAAFLLRATEVGWKDPAGVQAFYTSACRTGLFRQVKLGLEQPADDELVAASAAVVKTVLVSAREPSVFEQLAHEVLTSAASPAILGSLSTPAVCGAVLAALTRQSSALRPLTLDANPSRPTWLLCHIVDICLSAKGSGGSGDGGGGGGALLSRLSAEALGHLVDLIGELLPHVPPTVFVDPSDPDDDEDFDVDDGGGGREARKDRSSWGEVGCPVEPQWLGLRRLTGIDFTREVIKLLRVSDRPIDVEKVCRVINLTLDRCQTALDRATLLSVVSFEPGLVAHLWGLIASRRELLDKFVAGKLADYHETVAYARLFAGAYGHLLLTQDDTEFIGKTPERSREVREAVLDLTAVIEVVAVLRDLAVSLFMSDALYCFERPVLELRKSLCSLLKQLHGRDERISFCPPGHWLSATATALAQTAPLHTIEVEEFKIGEVASMFPKASKLIELLKTVPFVLPFDLRAKLFQSLIEHDRGGRDPHGGVFNAGNVFVDIRRAQLYEDAFDKLNGMGPGMRSQLRVRMFNDQGLEEAGVDGGGVFREFLASVIQEGYSLGAGLFRSTPEEQIYPHPQSHLLNPDALAHYEFLGRLLGKALYMGMLVELPFAPFFLSKLLGQQSFLNDLASLDPDLHRNLLFLKNYDGDCADLSLDFTIQEDDPALGPSAVVELVPNGRATPVTNDNRIRYVYHVANFRLNIQIRAQCAAFCRGLFDIINREWFLMFSPTEIQTLISGAEASVDVSDLRRNTIYSGGLTEKHPTVEMFWDVVREMDDEERHAMVKFVTSCRRPPLFGFAQLNPKFCIHGAGEIEDRLPTASTCMNLLKLPIFKSREVLKEKLMYAIKSGAGFELS